MCAEKGVVVAVVITDGQIAIMNLVSLPGCLAL